MQINQSWYWILIFQFPVLGLSMCVKLDPHIFVLVDSQVCQSVPIIKEHFLRLILITKNVHKTADRKSLKNRVVFDKDFWKAISQWILFPTSQWSLKIIILNVSMFIIDSNDF